MSQLNTKKIEAIGQEMLNQPLFYFSQASNELFHSNFIEWLGHIDEIFLEFIFDLEEITGISIKREERGNKIADSNGKDKVPVADIVVMKDNKVICVIENKVKNIPNKEQLNELTKAFKDRGQNIKYILLTFSKPLFPLGKWKLLTYLSFYNKIKKEKQRIKNLYHKEIINDYLAFLRNLLKVFKEFELNLSSNYDFCLKLRKNEHKILDKIKLWQLYQRHAGQHFEKIVSDSLDRKYENLKHCSQITTQKVAINFYFDFNKFEIGIQLEDNQFRRYIKSDKVDIETKAKKLKKAGIWFSNSEKWRMKKKKDFGKFDCPDNQTFLYLYDIDFFENPKRTRKEIISLVDENLSYIIQNRDDITKILK